MRNITDALPEPLARHDAGAHGIVLVYPSLDAVSRAAAALLRTAAEEAPEGEPFHVGLSGGSTPQGLYRLLGEPGALPWERTHLYWSDERMVPHNDAASNVAPVIEAIVDRVAIPPGNVHPIPTDAGSPEAAADEYETTLREAFGPLGSASSFDVSILGMGEDGHTASLFPEDFADGAPQEHAGRYAVGIVGPPRRPPRERVSLTVEALSTARYSVFLVAGEGKQEALRAATTGTSVPAGHVGAREQVIWLVDEAAAGEIVGGE